MKNVNVTRNQKKKKCKLKYLKIWQIIFIYCKIIKQ